MDKNLIWKRCFDLGKMAGKLPRPNPAVAAVILYKERIIGEGFTSSYGSNHAEVNAIQSISLEDKKLLPEAEMFVTLEPCCHHGLTPPCTELIVKSKIKKVNIAFVDQTEKVDHKGINYLKQNGVHVSLSDVNQKIKDHLDIFNVNHLGSRPFILLKWAKSKDGFIGNTEKQVLLSNSYTNIYTHKLRAFTDAILIGTNTARIDNPSLTTRNFPGESPIRIVLDRKGTLDKNLRLLSDDFRTIILTEKKRSDLKDIKEQVLLSFEEEGFLLRLQNVIFDKGINHLVVEGGGKLLRSFIKENVWDEAIIINTRKEIKSGIKAPHIEGRQIETIELEEDTIHIVRQNHKMNHK